MSVSYRKSTNIIAAGATLRITRQGSFFHVIEADKAFSVGFNNNGLSPFFAGLEYEVPDGTAFTSVQIENTSSDDLTISFGIGSGGVRDGRLTVTGKLDVADNGGASFDEVVTATAAVATATAAVATATAAVAPQVAADAWLDLDGYTRESFGNSSDIVTAADNVNGVEILYANMMNSSAGRGFLNIGTVIFFGVWANSTDTITRVRVPAGLKISFSETSDASILNIVYKVL